MGFIQVYRFFRSNMEIEQLNGTGWAKTYLLVDKNSSSAALIDPVFDFMNYYLEVLQSRDLSLKFVIATHTHADHITACYSLREKIGCEYLMWKDTACLGVSKYLDDGEVFSLGSFDMKVHHVPGHTNDHILIETSTHLFTGDFLFNGAGGVGRDDLPSGRLQAHWDSLKSLQELDENLVVCSGHEPPGTEMQSLAWNRINNPVLVLNTFDEFEAWQTEVTAGLGSVSKIKTALPANLFAEIPAHIPWMD